MHVGRPISRETRKASQRVVLWTVLLVGGFNPRGAGQAAHLLAPDVVGPPEAKGAFRFSFLPWALALAPSPSE